jgi:hypothetical protein
MARKRSEPRPYPATETGAAVAPVRRTATHKKTVRPSQEPIETATPAVSVPDVDEIARLAYSYWEARGGAHGSAEADWLRAEQELRLRQKS